MTYRPRLLLHLCCAPDAASGAEAFRGVASASGLFYNPNLTPGEEYRRRLAAMERLGAATGFPWREREPDHQRWEEAVRGMEGEPEKGRRCELCIRMRLLATAEAAREEGYDWFATVLTVSRRKDPEMINRIGEEVAGEAGVPYLPSHLRKKGGDQRSIDLSLRYGLYRQDFCGCRFSLRPRNASPPGSR